MRVTDTDGTSPWLCAEISESCPPRSSSCPFPVTAAECHRVGGCTQQQEVFWLHHSLVVGMDKVESGSNSDTDFIVPSSEVTEY